MRSVIRFEVVVAFLLGVVVAVMFSVLRQPAAMGDREPASAKHSERGGGERGAHHEEEGHAVELAPYMGELQRFSQKLGYAIEGRSAPLAEFYLHEVTEVAEEIEENVKEHDGFPIAALVKAQLTPQIAPLDDAVEAGDWKAAGTRYRALINSCNTCHVATEHAFIVLTPASGKPPFNQRFDVK